MIRVLIVDDSASVRRALEEVLSPEPDIEVMGSANDPYQAVKIIAQEVPDVILLDIEMPRLDGLSFLQRIMNQRPIPVVICSSLASAGSESLQKAFAYGAVDVITKPQLGASNFIAESAILIGDAVRAASKAKLKPIKSKALLKVAPKLGADAVLPSQASRPLTETSEKVIVVGASTGGTEALREFLEAMPGDSPGIVMVQHMPEKFTSSFAQRLNSLCEMNVAEAKNGDQVLRGHALIAPGNYHTMIRRSGAQYYVDVREGPLVNRHRPAVDVLFRSAAQNVGRNCIAIIMTGMGDDGARGMVELKDAGAMTLAQDEASSVVYGMPKEAVQRGAVREILPLGTLAPRSYELSKGKWT